MNKLKFLPELKELTSHLKKEGKRLVFTNGCFDILHLGHIRYLRAAKEEGDILTVGLNSDSSIRTIKGCKRPIVPQDQRAEVLAALEFVDYIVIFSEPDPTLVINTLLPDVLVKGEDWSLDKIVGREVVEANGGKVIRMPQVKNVATTNIIKTIIERYCNSNV
ncbi:MAG: D-glycero-beta-D-manno-heptose 1-phosphate adenylyltransferase [bacterium]